ncbi:hypothetical protein ANSO36C_33780 [Nostoc cf. commune SO-36]|uniref:GGDEF domain-containing protein n=1 Tax=Nostoc cf. commune SO-36 TaxID=449208 RepID=A0ABM7Z3J9_NOSCO|nr:hypothetical protein ANSO36C_33780 [Nostoc cf. commune SO-36]
MARYGGEEFSILLPNTDLAGSIKVAENIQQAIYDQARDLQENKVPAKQGQ